MSDQANDRLGDGDKGTEPGAATRTKLRAEGLTCPSCVATIERQLKHLPGVTSATVKFASGRIDVEHDAAMTSVAELEQAIQRAGYRAKAARV